MVTLNFRNCHFSSRGLENTKLPKMLYLQKTYLTLKNQTKKHVTWHSVSTCLNLSFAPSGQSETPGNM